MNVYTANRDGDFFGQPGHVRRIGVSVNGPNRRDERELVQNRLATDVSGMKDELDAR
jgi:hypothetical protein